MCTMKNVLIWIKMIENYIGQEYVVNRLPPNIYNNTYHRYAIKHGIVKKSTEINEQGFYVPKRDGDTANYVWTISIGDTKHRNFYNKLE